MANEATVLTHAPDVKAAAALQALPDRGTGRAVPASLPIPAETG